MESHSHGHLTKIAKYIRKRLKKTKEDTLNVGTFPDYSPVAYNTAISLRT